MVAPSRPAGLVVAAGLLAGLLVAEHVRSGESEPGPEPPPAEAAPPADPGPVGLVDMAWVFKNSHRFNSLREGIKAEIEQSDRRARQMAEEIQELEADLMTLVAGSDEHQEVQREIIRKTADLDAFRRTTQQQFLQKESAIYKEVYLEVTAEVGRYAREYGYAMVIRCQRDRIDDVKDAQEVLQHMNRQVIFYREEHDLTDAVLNRLNERFAVSVN